MTILSRRVTVVVFMAFAFAYFFSALIRAITATLSPTLTREFALNARDLGLLAGGYFLGFAAMQLPLGNWLDRHGPKKVILSFLSVAVVGCVAFSFASSFAGLLLARVMCGIGVSACLMAPLTGNRRWMSPASQLRANSWMLMTGSMGMVASTLPVQWLMPLWGWRPLFWGLATLVALAMAVIAWKVPTWRQEAITGETVQSKGSYAQVWRHPYFRKLAPLGFVIYGGLLAIQTLWVTPWMIRVAGSTAQQAGLGLFWINVAMLITFWAWGLLNPRLVKGGWNPDRLIALGLPFSFMVLAIIIAAGDALSIWSGVLFALYFMACSFVSLAQPAVGMAFPAELAGRALSAFNLVIFSGVFAVQWGIGLLVDGLKALGWPEIAAFQGAMGVFLACSLAAYLHFVLSKSHNQVSK
jgi:predicted MFS family arabinose efflux permease